MSVRGLWGVSSILLLTLLAVLGSAIGMLSILRPSPRPRLAAIWMEAPIDCQGIHAPTSQDVLALMGSGVFAPLVDSSELASTSADSLTDIDQLLMRLRTVQGPAPVIVYISAIATVEDGQQILLHGNSSIEFEQSLQRPLQSVLDAVAECQAPNKLLILELAWPTSGKDILSTLQRQLLSSPASDYPVLFACGSGEECSRTIFEPRRSVFSYFLELALVGHADGAVDQRRDGRITTQELGRFLQSNVPRYTGEVYGEPQHPTLLGAIKPFDVCTYSERVLEASHQKNVAVKVKGTGELQAEVGRASTGELTETSQPNSLTVATEQHATADTHPLTSKGTSTSPSKHEVESPAPPPGLPANQVYPAWLRHAWEQRDRCVEQKLYRSAPESILRLENQLLAAESAWQAGEPNHTRRTLIARQLNEMQRLLEPTGEHLTVVGHSPVADSAVSAGLYSKIVEFVSQAESLAGQTTSQPQVPPDAAPMTSFKQGAESVSPSEVHRAILAYIVDHENFNPSQLVPLKQLMSEYRTESPSFESSLLQALVDLPTHSHNDTAWRTVRTFSGLALANEQRAVLPELWPWLAELQLHCDQNRVAIEERVWSAEVNSPELLALVQASAEEQSLLSSVRQRLEAASDSLAADHLRLLQAYPLARGKERYDRWLHALEQVTSLRNTIATPANDFELMDGSQRNKLARQVHVLSAESETVQSVVDRLLTELAHGADLSPSADYDSNSFSLEQRRSLVELLGTSLPDVAQRLRLFAIARLASQETHQIVVQQLLAHPAHYLGSIAEEREHAERTHPATNDGEPQLAMRPTVLHEEREARRSAICVLATQLYEQLGNSNQNPCSNYYMWVAQRYRRASVGYAYVDSLAGAKGPTKPANNPLAASPSIDSGQRANSDALPGASTLPGGYFVGVSPGNRVGRSWEGNSIAVSTASRPKVALEWVRPGTESVVSSQSLCLRTLPGRQAFQLRIANMTPSPGSYVVELSTAAVNVRSAVIPVPGRAMFPVTFAGDPPKDGEQLPELTGPLRLCVFDASNGQVLLEDHSSIFVASPQEYVELVSARFTPFSLGRNQLEVWLRSKYELEDGPCTATLIVEPNQVDGLVAVTGGVRRTNLDTSGKATRLLAEGLVFEGKRENAGTIEITVDGVERVFRLHCDFARVGPPTTPRLLTRPSVKLFAPSAMRAGDPLSVRLQVDNAPPRSAIKLALRSDHAPSGAADRSLIFQGPKQSRIGMAAETGGDILFTAELSDWTAKLETDGLVGKRQLTAEIDAGSRSLAVDRQSIALDDRPPHYLQYLEVPQVAAVGSKQQIVLAANSPITGIASVNVMIGGLVEGKIPPGAEWIPCQPMASGDSEFLWRGEVPWPDQPGDFELTAMATNGAGLSTFESISQKAVTQDDLKYGTIRVKVLEGAVQQPGIDVSLLNASGQSLAQTHSNAAGVSEFARIAEGNYLLVASKPANGRQASKEVRVVAGNIVDVTLALRLAR